MNVPMKTYFPFFIISFFAFAIANIFVSFADAYFSGPRDGYTLLNGYTGTARALLVLILQVVITWRFQFYKNRTRLLIAFIVTVSLALVSYFLKE